MKGSPLGPPTSADIGDVTYTVQIPVRYMTGLQTVQCEAKQFVAHSRERKTRS
jgi:hypothetical protein